MVMVISAAFTCFGLLVGWGLLLLLGVSWALFVNLGLLTCVVLGFGMVAWGGVCFAS